MTRHPEMQPGQLVGYWPTEQVCRVVRTMPAGYGGWLYAVSPIAAPSVIHLCTADDLVRIPTPDAPCSPVARPATAGLPRPLAGRGEVSSDRSV